MGEGPDTPNCNEMLLQAVRTRNMEEVEHWLHHANLNVNYNIGGGDTILFESIRVGHEVIFLRLLDAGFDVNAINENQETPLWRAVDCLENNFFSELIKRGADINSPTNLGLLTHAVVAGNLDLVCMLVYYGYDVNSEDVDKLIVYAIENGGFDIAKILAEICDVFFLYKIESFCADLLLACLEN